MRLGLEKGHHLLILGDQFAGMAGHPVCHGKMGAVMITVNTQYQTRELEYLLRQSDTETLILMEGFRGNSYLDMIYEICPELHESKPGELRSARLPV